MCGILAISARPGYTTSIDVPLAAIKHRGPDTQGIFRSLSADCLLGHVRLSILDLSTAGHQPMTDTAGRFVISFNGEIYNYSELRSGLVQRHGTIPWKSNTDTEVVLEGFAREGIDFLDRLNGIFALTIYDAREQTLHVLRDPIGVKPLFISDQGQGVFFCSEMKGLLAFPALKRTLRPQSLADQLAFMYVPEPYTMYQEFQKVAPGICFTYRHGKLESSRVLFAHLHGPVSLSSETEAVEHLRGTFSSAVRRQLMSDVPVSLFLSGGLDSSALAYEVASSGASIKDAYTISFSHADRQYDSQSDDLRYAAIMAKRFGLELQVIPAKQDFLTLLPQLLGFMEDGFTDPSAINTYVIAAAARSRGIKVMLSGQGADEYLGGYRRYQAEKLLRKLPGPVRSILSALSRIAPGQLPGRFNAAHRRLVRLSRLAGQSVNDRMLGMYTWTAPETISNLLPGIPVWTGDKEFAAFFDRFQSMDVIDAMLKVDQYYDLMSLNLCYTDRMSMASGVEVRVPFLDFEMIRVMNAIPSALKVKGGQCKYAFKKAMEQHLPKEIIYREKAGFGLPIRSWLRDSNAVVNEYLDEAHVRRHGMFDPKAVRRIVDEQMNGIADHTNTVFTLLFQQMWLEGKAG